MRTLALFTAGLGLAAIAAVLAGMVGDPGGLVERLCGPGSTSLWTFDAWVTVPLALSGSLYLAGMVRIWSRAGVGRGVRPAQAAAYAGGWLALAAALVSPLHRWGEGLFSAHMVEHELVMAGAAPLLVLARPGAAFAWALPRAARHALSGLVNARGARDAWGVVTRPAFATVVHGFAIWAWHAPTLFDAAVASVVLHRLQHLAFLGTALLFWWSLLRRSPGAAAGSVVLTTLHTTLLGALLALAPRVLYPAQTAGAAAWGLTPLEDQQLAGLIMWVPAGTIYAAAALWFAGRWIRRSRTGWEAGRAVAPG